MNTHPVFIIILGVLGFFISASLFWLESTYNNRKEWSDYYKRYINKRVPTPATKDAKLLVGLLFGIFVLILIFMFS